MKTNPSVILERRVQKTIAYLSSERGRINWLINVGNQYSTEANLVAAIQHTTRLIKYESISEVFCEILNRIAPRISRANYRRLNLLPVKKRA